VRRSQTLRIARLLLAVGVASGVVVCADAGAADDGFTPCSTTGSTRPAGGAWTALRPAFPAGPATVLDVASPAFEPDTIYATNGTAVVRTIDGGCSWVPIFNADAAINGLVPQPAPDSISQVVAPSSATNSKFVYVVAEHTVGGVNRPVVYSNSNHGTAAWISSDPNPASPSASSLPAAGKITDLAACNLLPSTVYAVVDSLDAAGADVRNLYQSTDSGVTWQLRNGVGAPFPYEQLLVHPTLNNGLFALASGRLNQSNDAGAVFRTVGPAPSDATSADVAVGDGYIRLAQGHSTRNWVDVSSDGGLTWRSESTPIQAKYVAMAPLRNVVAVGDGKRVALVVGAATGVSTVDVTPTGQPPLHISISAPSPGGFSLVGASGGVVLRAGLTLAFKALPPGIIRLLPGGLAGHYFPPSIVPGAQTVTLPPGASQDLPYTLLLPRRPSIVDIMFLVDTTGSMNGTIAGLRQDLAFIVNDVGTLGLNVKFGLGDFKDLATGFGEGGGAKGDYPFALRRVIGPADAQLAAQIGKLAASGGGDTPEADLTALYQSTTGAGEAMNNQVIVDPGQQARYRPGSVRIAIVGTDAPFHQGKGYPSWSSVAHALRTNGVRQVGLSVGTASMQDLSDMATDSGAIAPEGGLDCNGDGKTDIQEGQPLVCPVSAGTLGAAGAPVQLGPAVVAMTEAVKDYRLVTVGVHAGNSASAGHITLVGNSLHPGINLKADNEIPFTVHYSCPSLPTRHSYQASVGADITSSPVASVPATLICLPGAKLPPALGPLSQTVLLAAPAAAAAAPPPNPVPNPNPNPNPNPVLNPSFGIADQKQEEPQLAFAVAPGEQMPALDELAMSKVTTSRWSTEADLFGAALLLGAAAGAAYRIRNSYGFVPRRTPGGNRR
jgi:hypothetical protein